MAAALRNVMVRNPFLEPNTKIQNGRFASGGYTKLGSYGEDDSIISRFSFLTPVLSERPIFAK
jgi:hypothetical protein